MSPSDVPSGPNAATLATVSCRAGLAAGLPALELGATGVTGATVDGRTVAARLVVAFGAAAGPLPSALPKIRS